VAPPAVSWLVTLSRLLSTASLTRTAQQHHLSGPEEDTEDYRRLGSTNQVKVFQLNFVCCTFLPGLMHPILNTTC
jgi:hypothetical protein